MINIHDAIRLSQTDQSQTVNNNKMKIGYDVEQTKAQIKYTNVYKVQNELA